jgi:S-adenosylmethionine:tRNA ribosyltransferase-isomerase
MRPATTAPALRHDVRMMVVEQALRPGGQPAGPTRYQLRDARFVELVDHLDPGDVLVVNDAATLPASLRGTTRAGDDVELRLCGPTETDTWRAVLLGAGDWHQRTEDRPPPPVLAIGAELGIGDSLTARIVARSPLSPRLVEIRFDRQGSELWAALYAAGKPVQYSYLQGELPLWSVQTVYGARPWAAEMPSAGRPLTWSLLLALRRRGVHVAWLTHAAGLSATGDPDIDRALPLPERFDLPAATARIIGEARARGGRVIAVGTTVVRALEGCMALYGELRPGTGVTDLVIDARFRPRVVNGLLTGVHDPSESHFALLSAFASEEVLRGAWTEAMNRGYQCHEFGDTSLILPAAA